MPYISQITLPSGSTYDIKDKNVWGSHDQQTWLNGSESVADVIDAIKNTIEDLTGGNAIVFKGVSTTTLTDGGNENPTVGGTVITAKATGDLYFFNHQEFIYGSDGKWHLLGSELGLLGALAYEDSASGPFTPAGTVSQPTFTGGNDNVTITTSASSNGNYTPTGTITGGTFSASKLTSTGSFTPAGNVTVSTVSTTNKTATVSTASGTATYTPAGTISIPTISVKTAGSTATVKNPTSQTVAKTIATAAPEATAPANPVTYCSVSNEVLSLYQLGYTTGDSITTSNVTVKTGDAAYESTQPTFNGTGTRLVTGNIAVPSSFSGSFSGTAGNVSVEGTPAGTVSSLAFVGDEVEISGTVTPTGTVSQPTFSGTQGTVTVS